MKVHRDKAEGSDGSTPSSPARCPSTTTYHAPCHLRAQNIGLKSRDLIKLTGTKITLVAECSAIDGTWGYREENYDMARKVAPKMAADIEPAGSDADRRRLPLANGGIMLETGTRPCTRCRSWPVPTASPRTAREP